MLDLMQLLLSVLLINKPQGETLGEIVKIW
jgi:hypothetical protein